MLCNDFEERLTDYLDGALEPEVHKTFAEHALQLPGVSRHSERSEKHHAGVQCCERFEAPRESGSTHPVEHDAGNGDDLRGL